MEKKKETEEESISSHLTPKYKYEYYLSKFHSSHFSI